jgi:hypothetical protein
MFDEVLWSSLAALDDHPLFSAAEGRISNWEQRKNKKAVQKRRMATKRMKELWTPHRLSHFRNPQAHIPVKRTFSPRNHADDEDRKIDVFEGLHRDDAVLIQPKRGSNREDVECYQEYADDQCTPKPPK